MSWPALAVGIGLAVAAGPANAFSWSADREQRTLELVRQFQAAHKAPSIAVAVTVQGKAVLEFGLDGAGSIAGEGPRVRYHLGSLTKQFTAAAVLALIEDRTIVPQTNEPLTLETKGRDLFPSVEETEGGKITVRQLLTMTSNIPSYTDDDTQLRADAAGTAPATRPVDVMQVIERLRTYKLNAPTGKFEYSNTNYFVLSLIIDVLKGGPGSAVGQASRDYIRQRLLKKAGLRETGFAGEPLPPGALFAPPTYVYPRYFDLGAWPKGAGDMISSADDMAQWFVALATEKVISGTSLHLMATPAAAVTESVAYRGCSYGMGAYVCQRPSYTLYQHDGVIAGYMASTALAQHRDGSWMSATVLANIDASRDIVDLVRNLIGLGAE